MEQVLTYLANPAVTVALAVLLVFGRMSLYFYRLIGRKKGFSSRPWASELSVLIGFGLAVWSLFLSPGWIGGTLAALTILAGGFILYLFSQNSVPKQIAVKLGDHAPAFTAVDWDGNNYDFAPGNGDPLLLKFYRGHW